MKTLIKIFILFSIIFTHYTATTYAIDIGINIGVGVETWITWNRVTNLETWADPWRNSAVNRNTHLQEIRDVNTDYTVWVWGETWIYNTLIRIARDLKNLFFIFSSVFFLVLVIKLLVSEKTETEVTNFKKWIIWISIWIVITQIAYYIVINIFDRNISVNLAESFLVSILNPLISVLETAASFIFIAIMIYAFFRLISANWDESKATSAKMSVFYAIVWFVVVKVAKAIVYTTYWKSNCRNSILQTNCINQTDLKWFALIIVRIIDWMNSFVWIVVILFIIYAWFLVLTSAWDDEKLNKAKKIIIYIVIWLAILMFNYLILTFFILPEKAI